MIVSYEVGAIFKIANEASPALSRILKQVRELSAAIDKARANLAELSKAVVAPGLTTAVAETGDLAKAWGDVAKNAAMAQRAIGSASTAAARAPAAAAAAATGGGNGRHRPTWLGRSGGGHHNALLAAGVGLGWGIDQAAKTADYVWRMEDISGSPHDQPTHARFRKILQDAQINTGFPLDDVGKSALSVLRLMQATPGNGIDTLPEMLNSAATEARRKNTGLEESTTSNAELAHQFRAYTPKAMQELFATFAALSTADPRSLSSMTRAAGYAVPVLSELGVDPASVLLAGTGLAQAGISSTKSGTWIREAVTRALPGIVLGHSASNKKHEEALRALGLVDANGKPTWFSNGKPDELKMFEIAGDAMQRMSPTERAVYGRAAFGAQGSGAVAVLGDPVVNARMHAIDDLRKSKAYTERYNSFGADYMAGSTMQDARTALTTFNVTMGELARDTLPAVNNALGGFKSILDGIRNILPGGDGKSAAVVGGHAMLGAGGGALAGFAIGAFGGPIGAGAGAIIGGVAGGVEGVAEQYMRGVKTGQVITGNSVAQTVEAVHSLADAIRGAAGGPGGIFAGGTSKAPAQAVLAPLSLNLNIDGHVLAQAMSSIGAASFYGQAPAFDGLSSFPNGDHQHTDK